MLTLCAAGGSSQGRQMSPNGLFLSPDRKASLGFRQLDDFELNAVFCGRGCGAFALITLIYESDVDALVCSRLDILSETADLDAIVRVGGSAVQGQEVAERVHRQM